MDQHRMQLKMEAQGHIIEYPNNTRDMVRAPTGKNCHNYDAEIEAIKPGTQKLLNSNFCTVSGIFNRFKISTSGFTVQKIARSAGNVHNTLLQCNAMDTISLWNTRK
jgi:hypothetical protein